MLVALDGILTFTFIMVQEHIFVERKLLYWKVLKVIKAVSYTHLRAHET